PPYTLSLHDALPISSQNSGRVEWLAGKSPKRPHLRRAPKLADLSYRPAMLPEMEWSLAREVCCIFGWNSRIPQASGAFPKPPCLAHPEHDSYRPPVLPCSPASLRSRS